MICRNPIVRGESKLDGSAHRRAVNRADKRRSHLMNRVEQKLAIVTHPLSFSSRLELEKFVDVRAGDPAVFLAAQQNSGFNVAVTLEPVEQRDELILEAAIEFVERRTRHVERNDSDAVDDLRLKCVWLCHVPRSTTMEKPIPPAAHTVINPNSPSRRASSLRSV